MFQVVLINRVMEQRELELPVSGDEIQEAYDQLKVLSGKLNDAPSGRLFRADFRTLQMCQSL